MTTTMTVNPAELAWALKAVLPHVSKDDTLPVICAVHIEVVPEDKCAYLSATDRYTLGVARITTDTGHEPASALLFTSEAKDLLRHCSGKDPEQLGVTPGMVTFGFHRFKSSDPAGFPNWRKTIAPMLKAPLSALNGGEGLNPAYLARFKDVAPGHLGTRFVVVRPEKKEDATTEPAPMILVAGSKFIGAIMSARSEDFEPLMADWLSRVAGERR